MLVQYFRRNGNRKKGVLVALALEDTSHYVIGYSMCNPQDRFDADTGVEIAANRAVERVKAGRGESKYPHSMQKVVASFKQRCAAYYKDRTHLV
jgi:hypothetical protein